MLCCARFPTLRFFGPCRFVIYLAIYLNTFRKRLDICLITELRYISFSHFSNCPITIALKNFLDAPKNKIQDARSFTFAPARKFISF